MEMPVFNFTDDTKDFDNDQQLDDAEKATEKRFAPGQYELKIMDAYWSGPANDPTWFKLKVVYGTGIEDDVRRIVDTVHIPTTLGLKYQKPGGKPGLWVWSNLCAPFLKAVDGVAKQSTLKSTLEKYFSKTKDVVVSIYDKDVGERVEHTVAQVPALLGKVVELKIGYKGYYCDRIADSEQWGIFLKGNLVTKTDEETGESVELVGDDRDDIAVLAQDYEIELTNLGIVKYFAKKAIGGSDAFADL